MGRRPRVGAWILGYEAGEGAYPKATGWASVLPWRLKGS